jgi:seryl-tRNA synthetase
VHIKTGKMLSNNTEALKSFLEQIYYVDRSIQNCTYNGDGVNIELDAESTSDREQIKTEILKLADSILSSFERVETRVISESDGKGLFNKDPMEELTKTRQVVQTHPGVYALQGEFLDTIRNIDTIFRRYALERGATEQYFQPTLPIKSFIENGYISSFPHHPMFVTTVERNAKSIRALSRDAREQTVESIHQWLDEKLDEHDQILSPTVCYHCFEILRNQVIPCSGAQFTAIAPCHRHESLSIQGLTRLQTFTMREIIFFGSADFVGNCIEEILEHGKTILSEWGVQFRIVTASDPFFAGGAELKRIYQSTMSLKYEIQAYLPHAESWLSIASFNNHQQSLVEPYVIKFDANEPLHSGCVGYGYERMAYAMYSQFGCDKKKWHASVFSQ